MQKSRLFNLSFWLVSIGYLVLSCNYSSGDQNGFSIGQLFSSHEEDTSDLALDFQALRKKASEALTFVKEKKMYEKRLLLIDMSRHSGLKRFYVWNVEKDTIEKSYLVSHGCCDQPWGSDRTKKNPTFSNVPESHCSSLGKYKLGERGFSNWGVNTKYFMHGLDSTNNNAYSRVIVFHSWEVVPDEEVYPKGTPEGWGCPAISNDAFREIDKWLKEAEKPVLMWIYD
jgi:hypothetical protein